MRTLLNIIWIVFAGFWLFLGYVLAGVLLCIPIITIPWAIASFRTAGYVIWPFGRTIVSKPTAGVGSFLGNVVWVIFAGWWLALGHLASGIALCITIIGIPMAIADFKMIPSRSCRSAKTSSRRGRARSTAPSDGAPRAGARWMPRRVTVRRTPQPLVTSEAYVAGSGYGGCTPRSTASGKAPQWASRRSGWSRAPVHTRLRCGFDSRRRVHF